MDYDLYRDSLLESSPEFGFQRFEAHPNLSNLIDSDLLRVQNRSNFGSRIILELHNVHMALNEKNSPFGECWQKIETRLKARFEIDDFRFERAALDNEKHLKSALTMAAFIIQIMSRRLMVGNAKHYKFQTFKLPERGRDLHLV